MVPSAADPTRAAEDLPSAVWAGIDLGGSSIKLGLIDDAGRSLGSLVLPTEVAKGPAAAVERMAAGVRRLLDDAHLSANQVAGIGLGAPGLLDRERRVYLTPANLPGWSEFPLADHLDEKCGVKTTCANDGTAAGYGEYWVGAGRQLSSMVLFTLGTGIGGAIFIGYLAVEGAHGSGAELGHTAIDYNETAARCPCGLRGHLEAYVGAPAVVRRAQERLAREPSSSLNQRLRAGEVLTPQVLAAEADRGDAVALEIVFETARYLGIAAVNALHTIDPAGIIIGGAMTFGGPGSSLGQRFLGWIREEIELRALGGLARRVLVDFAQLGADAGYVGAAGLARLASRKTSAERAV